MSAATVPGISSNGTECQQQRYRVSVATVPGVSSNGTGCQQYLERRGYGASNREQEAKEKLEKIRRTGKGNLNQAEEKLAAAKRNCAEILALHNGFETAMREAMEFIDLETGHIRAADEMEARGVMVLIDAAMKSPFSFL
jgi:hypothetical protein